jgi:endonuclease/exonuclease/phosphatase family metal-dependent hydrolase
MRGGVRIRVLSYNIHRAIGVDRLFRPERIVRILATHDADVVLLQEVDDGVPRSRELDLARELAQAAGYPHYAVGHNVSLRKGRYGNATLSRFPIDRERNIDLTIGRRKRRGCQHTRLRVTDGAGRQRPVEVFNLHLGLSARERAEQLALLARSPEFSPLGHARPCLVAGDFNDWRSLLQPVLEGMEFGCATQSASRPGRQIFTFPSFFPQGALDRIYFRGAVRLLAVKRCPLLLSKVASDHLPVVADFELGS